VAVVVVKNEVSKAEMLFSKNCDDGELTITTSGAAAQEV
jgi:hypothetical protein